MKLIISLLVSILLAAMPINCGYAANRQFIVNYNEDPNPPYAMGPIENIDWKKPGITIEVLKIIGENLGFDVVLQSLPDKRSFNNVANGVTDGSFHWSFNDKRAKMVEYPMFNGKIDPSKRLMTQTYVLYKLNDSNLTWDGAIFKNIKYELGANRGFSIIKDLQGKGVKVHEVSSTNSLIRMVLSRRIDGAVTIETYGDHAVEVLGAKNIDKVYPTVKQKDYYLVLSKQFVKNQPILASQIWSEIQNIKESGMYDKISRKYEE